MYLEYSAYLKLLLNILANDLGCIKGVGNVDPFPELVERLGEIQVEGCPPKIPGTLSSPVAFEIGKLLRAHLRRQIDPIDVAGAVKDLHATAGLEASRFFSLHDGEHGYINADVSNSFSSAFVEEALRSKGQSLFELESVLVSPTEETKRSFPSSGEVVPNWQKLFSRSAVMSDSSTLRLIECYERGQVSSRDYSLMLLALVADSELELTPFLQGVAGRENIPWYLARFREDVKRHLNVLDGVGAADESVGATPAFVDEYDTAIDEQLLRFRRSYRRARLGGRADLLLAEVLNIVRTFYGYYNRPQTRSGALGKASVLVVNKLAAKIGLMNKLVEVSLESLLLEVDTEPGQLGVDC